MKKLIYHINVGIWSDYDFFFDSTFNLISYWSNDDATWHSTYLNQLMEFLEVEVVETTFSDERFKDKIIKTLKNYLNATDEDIKWIPLI